MVKHVDKMNRKTNGKTNATKDTENELVAGIDTYFKELVEEVPVPLFGWLKKEDRIESFPEKLRDENFWNEVDKLEKRFKKYLFNAENRGRTIGSKNKVVLDDKKKCNGPLCNGKECLVAKFANSYCDQCDKFLKRYGIRAIFNNLTKHSEKMSNNSKHIKEFESVGEISKFIRLEVFYKLWEGNYKCAISGNDLEDFTGLFIRDRPKNLEEIEVGDERWLNHWSIDRIDHRKGYVFDNIQIISRKLNSIKGTIEQEFSSWKLENTSQLKLTFKKLFVQLELIYD